MARFYCINSSTCTFADTYVDVMFDSIRSASSTARDTWWWHGHAMEQETEENIPVRCDTQIIEVVSKLRTFVEFMVRFSDLFSSGATDSHTNKKKKTWCIRKGDLIRHSTELFHITTCSFMEADDWRSVLHQFYASLINLSKYADYLEREQMYIKMEP